MVLAAVSFADPLMLVGLLAALVPVALHLLNRMRAPVVVFPTLRFLKLTAQKTARRRHLQQYFLLLVRVIVFALIAMTVAMPLIRGGSAGLAYGFVGMLLLGLRLLVPAGVMVTAGKENRETRMGKREKSEGVKVSPQRKEGASGAGSMSGVLGWVALAMAVLLGGYAVYGLVSERYFSNNRAGEFSGDSTAMVIVFDNSHSMLAGDGPAPIMPAQTHLTKAKALVRQLVSDQMQPREAALVPTNPGLTAGTPGFTANMYVLAGQLEKLSPEGAARPMQERLRAALELLATSQQPSKMLVVVSDFARPGFSDADVFAALKELPSGLKRQDLQVVLMPVRGEAGVVDVGVASFGLAEGTQRPVVGAEVTFEAQIINNADAADVRDVIFTVDGKPLEGATAGGPLNPRVQLGAAGTGTGRVSVRIPYRLRDAGTHRFGMRIQEVQDAMAWDDAREMTVEVADQVKVMVVGGDEGAMPRARSAGFYVMTALAPFEGARGPDGKPVAWPVKPAYRGIAAVEQTPDFAGMSAVFMCDVPRVSAGLADKLTAYAKGGGRIVWVLGPSVDGDAYNKVVAVRGLLPANLVQPLVAAKAAELDWVDMRSGLFMNLFDNQEPFRQALIMGRWSLAENPSGRVLAKLADGVPLVLQHDVPGSGATGHIYTVLTTPGAEWSNLGATVLLVPLASRMALGDFQETGVEGNAGGSFETGQTVGIHIASLDSAAPAAVRAVSVDVTTPQQVVINVKPTVMGNAGVWNFDRAMEAGEYAWKSSDGRFSGAFVVNPPGEEADLQSADVPALARESSPGPEVRGGKETVVAATVPELLAQMQHRAEGTSLMPGFLSLVLMLAVVEAMLANRARAG